MSDIKINVDLNSGSAQRGLQQLRGAIGGVGSAANGVTGSFLKLAAAAGGIAGAVKGLQSIAQTGASFEDLRTSLNSVFGSVEAGTDAFAKVQDFAKTTQLSVQQLTKNFVQLKAAGVEPTTDLLRVFADTASVTTDELGTFQASMDLIARTTAGGLGLEELNRLADRGVPVFDILNEKMGITRLEISQVGKTAEGARQIIDALTEGLEERFGGASLARAQNLNQILNNLGDEVDALNDSLFQAGFGDFFKTLTIGFSTIVGDLANFVDTSSANIGIFLDNMTTGFIGFFRGFIIGVADLIDTFRPIFDVLRSGFNNLVGFLNVLPPELKALGLIGFLMLGGKGKLIFTAIIAGFDLIVGVINKVVQGTENMLNSVVNGINVLIQKYNSLAEAIGLSVIQLDEITDFEFPEITTDDVKNKLTEIADLIFDMPLLSEVGPLEESARRYFDETLMPKLEEFRSALRSLPAPTVGDGDPEGDGEKAGSDFAKGWSRGLEAFKTATLNAADYGERIFETMSQGFTDSIMAFVETGKLSFKDLFKSLMTEIIKMQANRIFLSLFGGAGSLFGGLFAEGGYLPAGQFGIVGERGPEIINGPARITGTDETARLLASGRSATQITYNINAVDVQSFRQALARDPEYIYNLTRVGARRVPG